jgi:diguanylate cyclase (GGDEF)-like protein/PAS domain S-box-containing protein
MKSPSEGRESRAHTGHRPAPFWATTQAGRRLLLLIAALLLAARPVYALDPAKRIEEYVLDQWDVRHGLPFTTVRAIRQTPDGYLWLGTQSGLVRFDGAHFSLFDVQNAPELGHNHIWSLAVTADGSLWIGSNGSLSRWANGHFTKERADGQRTRTLLVGREGSLWIGTVNGGVDRWKPRLVASYTASSGLGGDSVMAVTEDSSGAVWFGTNHGVDRLVDGVVRHEAVGPELVWSMLTSRDGSVWIGTEGGGLVQWKDGTFRRFTANDGLPGNEVRSLLEDRDGNLWVGTNNGLGRMTKGRWARLSSASGLSSNLVRSIFEDSDGNLWIGLYGGGLSRLRDGEFTSLSVKEGLIHDLAWGIAETPDGSIWVSTQGGVSRLRGGAWTSYRKASGLSDDITRALLVDRRGVLWAGSNRGVSRFENGRWVPFTGGGLATKVVQSIRETRDGSLWFGTWEGLSRLRAGQVSTFSVSDKSMNEIRAIHEDRRGTIWLGTSSGLARLVEDRIEPYVIPLTLPAASVEAIHEDEAGVLWFGTDGAGLLRLEGGKWTRVTTREGFFEDTVFHILEDGSGHLWLGGARGVFEVGLDSLQEFSSGRTTHIKGTLYGVAHGMKSSECTGGGAQPGAFRDRGGRLWFPTNQGVVMIDPERLKAEMPAPLAHIEDVRLDRSVLATSGRVVAGPGRGDLEIRYAAVDFLSPGDVRFRYRLEGYDPGWVDAADRRVAHYANLEPGHYRFTVSASSDESSWTKPPAVVEIDFRPHLYETDFFRGLGLLAVGAAGLSLHRSRVRRLARREAELVGINEALHESEERYAVAAQGANDGLWDWNLKNDRIHYSPRWKSMLGYEGDEVRDQPEEWLGRIHPDDQAQVRLDLEAHKGGASSHFESEHRIRHKDGGYLFVLSRGLVVRNPAGQAVRIAGSQTDITLRKRTEEQILHDALHDPLTGLPNRNLFLDRLGQAVARRRRHDDYHFAVLFLDLDRFKLVNDSLGHLAGDRLLVELAKRLSGCLRSEDTVARLGGDEFAILLDEIEDVRDATRVAERIREEQREPFSLDGHDVFSTASIGITLDDPRDRPPEELLRDADTAMYRAKGQGRDRHEIFDDAMHSRAVAVLKLETDLRRALERSELRLVYQPIVSLSTGRMVGAEALVRWEHPERGLLAPDLFVPLAEETGLILNVGHFVLREACRMARRWQDATLEGPVLSMSVNLSAREFAQTGLVDRVESLLAEFALEPARLRIEITESLIMEDPEAAVARCRALRDLGVGIDIDDFGTGYSSLSYLRRFPVDALKIDRSFVGGMDGRTEDHEIVRAIVGLAAALGIKIVAEGVETIEQLKRLKELGCELGQGYLFARPVEAEEAFAYFERAPVTPRPDRSKSWL